MSQYSSALRLRSPAIEEIQAWLVSRVAARCGLDPDRIDVRERFSRLGDDFAGGSHFRINRQGRQVLAAEAQFDIVALAIDRDRLRPQP